MTDNSISQSSINMSSINDNCNSSLFEQCLIKAYKDNTVLESYRSLLLAISYIKEYIDSVISQSSPIDKPLLTKHIVERLKRIANRHYFHLTIQISKIYIALLHQDNLPYVFISTNSNPNPNPNLNYDSNNKNTNTNTTLLIQISNDIIMLLDIIKFTPVHKTLLRITQDYLKFLLDNTNSSSAKFNLSEEQRESIHSLLLHLPSKYISDQYSNFPNRLKELLIEKRTMKTFNEFTSLLTMMISIEEEYDSLKKNESLYFITNYLKLNTNSGSNSNNNISNGSANKDDSDLLFAIGKMITLFIFNTKYTIKAKHTNEDNSIDNDNDSDDDSCKIYLLLDAQKKNISKIQASSYRNISLSFLNDAIYEINDEQKEVMINHKALILYLIKLYIAKVLQSFPNKFDILYVCFVLLKRVLVTLNEPFDDYSRLFIEVIDNILNIIKGHTPFSSEIGEIADLMQYLLITISNKEVAHQIMTRLSVLTAKGLSKPKLNPEHIPTEVIHIKNFNLLIGYPLTITIEPGTMHTQYIETTNDNSLIHIYFALNSKDISFSLLKYNPNNESEGNDDDETDQGHFSKVFQLDYVKYSATPIKVILFAQSPGVYKVIFDNSYSWITSKEVKCRINALRPLTPINPFEDDICDRNDSQLIISNKKKFNVYYNSIDYSFDIEGIETKIKDCQAKIEKKEIIVIPIVFYSNRLSMIVNGNTLASSTYIDSNNPKWFSKEFTIESIDNYLIENKIIDNQSLSSIILSFLSLNNNHYSSSSSYDSNNDDEEEQGKEGRGSKDNNTNTNTNSNTTNSDDFLRKETIDDYLKSLMLKHSNKIKYYFNSLSDIALIHSVYSKEKDNKEYETLIYFHIDTNIAQVSVYNDGMIYEEIIGFNYDANKPLIDNSAVFIDVIKKANDSFENIKVELSYTNVDIGAINNLIINLGKETEKIISSINVIPINLTSMHLLINNND